MMDEVQGHNRKPQKNPSTCHKLLSLDLRIGNNTNYSGYNIAASLTPRRYTLGYHSFRVCCGAALLPAVADRLKFVTQFWRHASALCLQGNVHRHLQETAAERASPQIRIKRSLP